jgi:hypothetical protein
MKITWDAENDLYVIGDEKDSYLCLTISQLEELQKEIERTMKEVSS